MDEYSGKRAIEGLVVSRKGPGHVLKDAGINRGQNGQFCNRVGCNGRLNSMKINQVGCAEKAKPLRPSLRSASSGKEIVGSSSRTSASISKPRKPFTESRRKALSRVETDSSENSSVQDEPQVSKLIHSSRKVQGGSFRESRGVETSKEAMMEVGNSSVVSHTRSKSMNVKSGSSAREISTSSSASLATKTNVQATQANASRYGLRNLRCNSISDVVPSIPDSNLSRRKDVPKKRNSEGENRSSLVRGKKLIGRTSEGRSCNSSHGVSISDSRRSVNAQPPRDNVAGSVRTRRSVSGYSRARLSDQETGNSSSPTESLIVSPHSPQPELPVDLTAPISLHQFSGEAPFNRPSSRGSSSGSLRSIMPSSPRGVGITRSFMNRNMDGIAEVLLALERIEQDEELTYEQLLVLETNLFIGGLNFYDQHREMRLDIDNMSYEELLALEERMGSVSTALTEEALSKCLTTSIYQSIADDEIVDKDDDIRCSICQEEYALGDELGRLECEHKYHMGCIHQWLRLKNWCPVCKTEAGPSS